MMDLEKSFRAAGREDWHPEEQMDDTSGTDRFLMAVAAVITAGLALWLFWSLFAPTQAEAQQQPVNCKPLPMWEAWLSERFHEKPRGFGLVDEQNALLFYATKDGTTFTILRIQAGGVACLFTSGTHFDVLPTKQGEES